MLPLVLVLLVLGALFAVLLVIALGRLRKGQLLTSTAWGMQSLLVLALFFVVLLVASNLNTYFRLNHEQVVAQVYIRQLGLQKYQLALEQVGVENQDQQYFQLQGDEWQLDGRVLKWKGWANLLGLDSFFQLSRLSGRFRQVEQARAVVPTVFDLLPPGKGLNLWRVKRQLGNTLWFMDAYYGQSVYMPMANGAHFEVSLGQSGLVVRPRNAAAEQALEQW